MSIQPFALRSPFEALLDAEATAQDVAAQAVMVATRHELDELVGYAFYGRMLTEPVGVPGSDDVMPLDGLIVTVAEHLGHTVYDPECRWCRAETLA